MRGLLTLYLQGVATGAMLAILVDGWFRRRSRRRVALFTGKIGIPLDKRKQ
jgi:hypothetical protein